MIDDLRPERRGFDGWTAALDDLAVRAWQSGRLAEAYIAAVVRILPTMRPQDPSRSPLAGRMTRIEASTNPVF